MANPKMTQNQRLLEQNITQRSAVETSTDQARSRLNEIDELLEDPKSNVEALVKERRVIEDSLGIFGGQLRVLSNRITDLEDAISTEAESKRVADLEALLGQKKKALEPHIEKVESLIEQLTEALREAYKIAQPINAIAGQLGRPHPITFGTVKPPVVTRNSIFGAEIAIGTWDWLDWDPEATQRRLTQAIEEAEQKVRPTHGLRSPNGNFDTRSPNETSDIVAKVLEEEGLGNFPAEAQYSTTLDRF